MATQKACYRQAREYVGDANKSAEPEHDYWAFTQAHYDPTSKICYVQYDHTQSSPASILWMVLVTDAFEGKDIASFVGASHAKSDEPGAPYTESKPMVCHVLSEKCDSRAEFNGLLWKLLPAFRPVTATSVD